MAVTELSIAAVGDSFAFGACVAADKNFVAEIRRTYPATLNLGINGAGPLVEFAAVKEFLALFRPKVTLWFYLELNDHSELSREKRSGLLMQYLNDNFKQSLVGRQSEIDRALKEFVDRKLSETKEGGGAYFKYALNVIKLSTLRTKLGLVQGTPEAEFNELPITLFRDILKSTQAFVKTWAGSLYFVYLPAWQRYVNPGSAPDDRDAMLKLIRGLDIPVIDVHQAFAAHGDPLRLFPFRKQGHYNDEGHRQVAQTVVRSLTSRP